MFLTSEKFIIRLSILDILTIIFGFPKIFSQYSYITSTSKDIPKPKHGVLTTHIISSQRSLNNFPVWILNFEIATTQINAAIRISENLCAMLRRW